MPLLVCVSSFVNGWESKYKGSSVLWITNIPLCAFIWNPKNVYGIISLENNLITPELLSTSNHKFVYVYLCAQGTNHWITLKVCTIIWFLLCTIWHVLTYCLFLLRTVAFCGSANKLNNINRRDVDHHHFNLFCNMLSYSFQ